MVASLMLNRLMFVYFIQRQGFLDNDPDYLKNRLALVQQRQGKGKFLTFYRYFLLRLFHEGFAQQPVQRAPDLEELLGHVPYLNGGLFELHALEQRHTRIDIADEAFERLFAFFDQYEWHLDTRPLRNDREINPDVLGYIFEKYINQKQMGAYYTKEDITEYIAKNTVVPCLFDIAEKKCAIAFQPDSALWRLLRDDPDRYLYEPVRKGVDLPLPAHIARGIEDFGQRGKWNRPADPAFSLPTETWREHVARRQRCQELRDKLQTGEVHQINDLITYNLDIRQFAEDVIASCEGPELVRAFYQAISTVTILDPTCGSGAFLFAALNILEPLYEACLDRMQAFVDDLERSGERSHPSKFADFRRTLAEIDKHPNRCYFILKSIIGNNLYGVDIMEEAAEICKLRLFLQLVAQVDRIKDLEPLPDINFNIRPGNTLVGFVSVDEIRRAAQSSTEGQGQLIFGETEMAIRRIEEEAEIVERAFQKFHEMQTGLGMDAREFASSKQELRQRLKKLADELDRYLAGVYGIDPHKTKAYDQWHKSHQPFHWFAEFYGIMSRGGFDAIIGNPPYVEYKDVSSIYQIVGYSTETCGNLFTFVLERCVVLGHEGAQVGMIIPLSAFSTDRMTPFISYVKRASSSLHVANFGWRPGKLFDGVNLQLSILLQRLGTVAPQVFSTQYILWDSEARPELFYKIQYDAVIDEKLPGSVPKLGCKEAVSILRALRSRGEEIGRCFDRRGQTKVFYRRGGLYWKVFVDFETGSSEEKIIGLQPKIEKYTIIATLSSNLWFWYFTSTSDCRHLGNRDIATFPFDPWQMHPELHEKLASLGREYVRDLKRNAQTAVRVYKGKKAVECLSFRVKESKPIIDEIDRVLAEHYGFTDEELDFIINCDIKYRLGQAEVEGE